jgi:hypothetical protein
MLKTNPERIIAGIALNAFSNLNCKKPLKKNPLEKVVIRSGAHIPTSAISLIGKLCFIYSSPFI